MRKWLRPAYPPRLTSRGSRPPKWFCASSGHYYIVELGSFRLGAAAQLYVRRDSILGEGAEVRGPSEGAKEPWK